VVGEKPVPVPLFPPKIPHVLTRDRTRASTVGGRRLTAWAMARPMLVLDHFYMKSAYQTSIKDYTRIFGMVYKGNAPFIQCKLILRLTISTRETDGLRLVFINFIVAELTPRVYWCENAFHLSENIARLQTMVYICCHPKES
jgi:hypothetical protein